MRAAVLHEIGAPLVIEDVEIEAPRAGEVAVRLVASGVCHSDLHTIDGSFPWPLPAIFGHEGAGVVEAVGAGVRTSRRATTRCWPVASTMCSRRSAGPRRSSSRRA